MEIAPSPNLLDRVGLMDAEPDRFPLVDHGFDNDDITVPSGAFNVAVSPALFRTDEPRPQ